MLEPGERRERRHSASAVGHNGKNTYLSEMAGKLNPPPIKSAMSASSVVVPGASSNTRKGKQFRSSSLLRLMGSSMPFWFSAIELLILVGCRKATYTFVLCPSSTFSFPTFRTIRGLAPAVSAHSFKCGKVKIRLTRPECQSLSR